MWTSTRTSRNQKENFQQMEKPNECGRLYQFGFSISWKNLCFFCNDSTLERLIFLLIFSCVGCVNDPEQILRRELKHAETVIELGLAINPVHDGIIEFPDPIFQKPMTKLPAEIGRFTNVEKLWLTGNHLDMLPSEFGNLKKLRELDLSFNRFVEFPASIYSLVELEALILSTNQISCLPSKISQLAKLKELRLSGNRISELPVEIGSLQDLESLSLSRNRLTALPAEVGKLSHLTMFWLDKNFLDDLPGEIGNRFFSRIC